MIVLEACITFLVGASLSLLGALMLAIPRPLPNLAYAVIAKFIMDAGFGIAATATFRVAGMKASSNPRNKNFAPYNPGTIIV